MSAADAQRSPLAEIADLGGPPREVTVGRLLRGGLALLRRSPWPVWGLGLAWVITGLGQELLSSRVGGAAANATAVNWIRQGIDAAQGALLGGLLLRCWLRPDRPWWRLDRGFAAFVAISLAASLIHASTDGVEIYVMNFLFRHGMTPYFGVVAALVPLTGIVLELIAVLLLMLWPMSLLAGERVVTPWRSVGLMWPAPAAAYVVAVVAVALPLLVLMLLAEELPVLPAEDSLSKSLIESVPIAFADLFTYAAAAIAYHLLARRPNLAEAFD